MAGLLASLDGASASASVSVDFSALTHKLEVVTVAVEALTRGPDVLADLDRAIATLPLPPELDGLPALAAALTALPNLLELDKDATIGALQPILAPLSGLSVSLSISGGGGIAAIVELVRAGLALATGRQHGGPLGMPDAFDPPQQQKPSLTEIRQAIVDARAVLARIGPFDAPSLFAKLQAGALGFARPLVRFVPLPLVDDLMQPMATVESWRGQSGAALAASLGTTLGTLAAIIDIPRIRVAGPIVEAADQIADAPARLAMLAGQVATNPETVAAEIHALASLLHPDQGPFRALRELPNDLTHARLLAVRAVEPPATLGPAMARVKSLIERIPSIDANPMADIVGAIEGFDLSALTDTLATVRDAVDTAVTKAEAGRTTVKKQLVALLAPADVAVTAARDAFDPSAVIAALAALPAQLETFVNSAIAPVVDPLKSAITAAVSALDDAAQAIDPTALIKPIEAAMREAAALINDPQVAEVFVELEQVLDDLVAEIEAIDLSAATSEVVAALGEIEAKMREIDPAKIPDPVKPPLKEVRDYLVGIDVTAEIGGPAAAVGKKLSAATGQLFTDLERGLEEVRMRVERFRPSAMVAGAVGPEFAALGVRLESFRPGQLLGGLQARLDGLAARAVGIGAGAVTDPLQKLHVAAMSGLDAIAPTRLLAPVEAAIQRAIADVLAASGFDTALDGVTDLVAEVNLWVGLAAELATVLDDAAALFANPGDSEAAVRAYVEEALDRLDPVDLAQLGTAFAAVAEANQRNSRAAVAAAVAPALRRVGSAAAAIAASPGRAALSKAIAGLPAGSARAELIAADVGLASALVGCKRLEDDIDEVAGALFERMLDYEQAELLDGGSVLAPLMQAPQTIPTLKAAIRPALEDAVREPLLALSAGFEKIAPYLAGMAGGLAAVVRAAHAKVDAISGTEGLGGVTGSIDTLVDRVRNFDLAPVSAPLAAVHANLVDGIAALSPDGLAPAITAANKAMGDLLNLGELLPATEINSLDKKYLSAVQQLKKVDPVALVGGQLDPLFKDLMAVVLPLFDLPARLRGLSDAAVAALGTALLAELAKVEAAFDSMLNAIPLDGGGGSGSISVSASVSVG